MVHDGQLFVFGRGASGQLGLGDKLSRARPALVEYFVLRGYAIARVACGSAHTVATTMDGALYTWGCADDGRLGLGLYEPTLSSGGDEGSASMRLSTKGEESCDGGPRLELGDQSIPTRVTMFGAADTLPPPPETGAAPCDGRAALDSVALDVACGAAHTLVVSGAGRVRAFGAGGLFQLGNGHPASCWSPVAVDLLRARRGAAHQARRGGAVGENAACFDDDESDSVSFDEDAELRGSAGAAAMSAAAAMIARNAARRMPRCFKAPTKECLDVAADEEPFIIALAAGVAHSVALSARGEVYAWGYAESGAVGGEASAARSSGVADVAPRVAPRVARPYPQCVGGLPCAARAIAAGAFATFVTLDAEHAGEVWAFGANDDGQLGVPIRDLGAMLDALHGAASVFEEVRNSAGECEGWFEKGSLDGGASAKLWTTMPPAIAAYRSCAAASERSVAPALVLNDSNAHEGRQLRLRRQRRGRRRQQRRRVATALQRAASDGNDLADDDAEDQQQVGLAATRRWAWGSIGRRVSIPTRVELPFRAAAVSTAMAASCAVGEGGELWCWGARSPARGATPAAFGGSGAARVAHAALCWEARNASGIVVGALDASTSSGATGAAAAAALQSRAVAVDAALRPLPRQLPRTEVLVFGSYEGDGDSSGDGAGAHETPRVLPQLSAHNVVQVTSGASHSLALTAAGAVFAWGRTLRGEGRHWRSAPRRVAALDCARAVACGAHHCVALLAAGGIVSWDTSAPLNRADASNEWPPTVIVEIAGGGGWTLAVTDDSRLLWSKEADAPTPPQHALATRGAVEPSHRDSLPTSMRGNDDRMRALRDQIRARERSRSRSAGDAAEASAATLEQQLVHSALAAAQKKRIAARLDPFAVRHRRAAKRAGRRDRKQAKTMDRAMLAVLKSGDAATTSSAGQKARRSLAKLSRAAEGKFVAPHAGGGSARAQRRARSASGDSAGGGRQSPVGDAERELAPIVNKSASGKGVSIRFSDAQLSAISTEPGAAVAASPAQISAVSQRRSASGGVSYTFDIEEPSAMGGGGGSDGAAADADDAAATDGCPGVVLGAQQTLPRPDSSGSVIVGSRPSNAPLYMAYANEVGSAIASSRGVEVRGETDAGQRDAGQRDAALRPAMAASAFGWFARSAVGDLFAPPSVPSSDAAAVDALEQRSRAATHGEVATRTEGELQGSGGDHAARSPSPPMPSPSPSPSPSSPVGGSDRSLYRYILNEFC